MCGSVLVYVGSACSSIDLILVQFGSVLAMFFYLWFSLNSVLVQFRFSVSSVLVHFASLVQHWFSFGWVSMCVCMCVCVCVFVCVRPNRT